MSASINIRAWHGGKNLIGIEYVAFFMGGKFYMIHTHDLITKDAMGLITKQV